VAYRQLIGGGAVALAVFLGVVSGGAAQGTPPLCLGSPATMIGTEGPDTLRGTDGPDVILGLGGDDTIDGLGGDDKLCGGTGDDIIYGRLGNDAIEGAAGTDVAEGGPGNDRMDGGDGTDIISFLSSPPVRVDLSAGAASGDGLDTFTSFEAIGGSTSNDVLTGDNGGLNFFFPLEGNDEVHGGGGLDVLAFLGPVNADLATRRSTTIFGGRVNEGVDTFDSVESLSAGTGAVNSTFYGDENDNILFFAARMFGRGGDDRIVGSAGNDSLDGGPGADLIKGKGGNDAIDGGPGEDIVSYVDATSSAHVNLATGVADGDGHDTISNVESVFGSANVDVLVGSQRPNSLYGIAGDDTLAGGAGDDYLAGGSGSDAMNGGPGSDYCVDGERRKSCEVNATTIEPFFSRRAPRASQLGGGDAAGAVARKLAGLVRASRAGEDARSARVAAPPTPFSLSRALGLAPGGVFARPLSLPDRVTPHPGAPVCQTRGGRFVTWIKPPDNVKPIAGDDVDEVVTWRAKLLRLGGGNPVVRQMPVAHAQIAGPGFNHPGLPSWLTRLNADYPNRILVPVRARGRYRWVTTIEWTVSYATLNLTRLPHYIEPGGARRPFCRFGR
jgi:Ca2+-binding RTX toxin-like protein